jgi:hypothetical protein
VKFRQQVSLGVLISSLLNPFILIAIESIVPPGQLENIGIAYLFIVMDASPHIGVSHGFKSTVFP